MKTLSSPLVAIIYLSIGIAAFAIQDLILKLASTDYPIHQALVIRGLAAIPVALLTVYLAGTMKALKGSTRAMWPRSLLIVITNFAYYMAVAALPLATVSALYLTTPFIITILSVLFLQEKVNYIQWGALIGGFLGALIIVHPGEGAFEWAMLLPLLAALAYAGSVVLVRKMEGEGLTEVIAFQGTTWLSVMGLVLALALGLGEFDWEVQQHPSLDFLLRGWQQPDLLNVVALLICGVVGAAATLMLTKGYAASSASHLAPFEYTALLWSIVLGWLIWDHLPTGKEWLGMALLVAAGLISVYAADKGEAAAAAVKT